MKIPTIAAAALMLATTPAWADQDRDEFNRGLARDLADLAPETAQWSKVGAWTVRVDLTGEHAGCYVSSAHEDGTVLRVGVMPKGGSAYALLNNDAWASLESGQTYDLESQFDQHPAWSGEALVLELGGAYRFLWLTVGAPWLNQFALSRQLVVRYEGNPIARLDLTGSRAATQEMLACQEAMTPSTDDPFTVVPTPADPFA